MNFYAQYDDNFIIFSVVQTPSLPQGDNIVQVSDDSVLGRRYHPDTGEFEEVPQEETVNEPPLSDQVAQLKTAIAELTMMIAATQQA